MSSYYHRFVPFQRLYHDPGSNAFRTHSLTDFLPYDMLIFDKLSEANYHSFWTACFSVSLCSLPFRCILYKLKTQEWKSLILKGRAGNKRPEKKRATIMKYDEILCRWTTLLRTAHAFFFPFVRTFVNSFFIHNFTSWNIKLNMKNALL